MATYLYGLTLSRNADRVPANAARIVRAVLRVVHAGDLSAIVSTIDAPVTRRDRDFVVAHDVALTQVVRRAVTVVASRFGQTFADDEALRAELASSPSRHSVLETLERYDGYGEMRIVMRDVIDPPASLRASITAREAPGRAYLESLREKLMPRPPVDFRALAGDLVLDERVERRGDIRTVSHLVRFEDEAKYRAELYAHPALEGATITGPHALYTFAEPAA